MEATAALGGLAALAQETRLRIFRLLVEQGPRGMSAGAIGRTFKLPPATLSFHVKELAAAGLVSPRQQGRFIYYATDFAAMRDLIAYLTDQCCRAEPEAPADLCVTACAPACLAQATSERPAFAVPKPCVRPKRRAA